MESLKEIPQLLNDDTRADVKEAIVEYLLGLTGSTEFLSVLYQVPEIIAALGRLMIKQHVSSLQKNALLCIVNIAAEHEGATVVWQSIPKVAETCLRNIVDKNCGSADNWCMLLSNLSRPEHLAERLFAEIKDGMDGLFAAFIQLNYNTADCHLSHLASVLSNFSQVTEARAFLSDVHQLNSLLPYITCTNNVLRKRGVVALLRNICFDSAQHKQLLEDFVILPTILMPLAGPEELSDEDNDKLPIELQYLDSDKAREPDADIRKMLLETLSQLCATRHGREYLRLHGAYEILRELHKWENAAGDPNCLAMCENVVDVLIRTEDEIGEDNLKTLDIPDDLIEKFEKLTE